MSNQNWQQQVDTVIQLLGGYWDKREIFIRLVEEVGEAGRALRTSVPRPETNLSEELADTFISLVALANVCDIDLVKAVKDKLDHHVTSALFKDGEVFTKQIARLKQESALANAQGNKELAMQRIKQVAALLRLKKEGLSDYARAVQDSR